MDSDCEEQLGIVVKSFMPHEGATARFRMFPARKNSGSEGWIDTPDRKRKELERRRKAEIECSLRYCNEQVAIERKNLVKITRLCVRELVDLYSYCPLDEDNSIVLNLCVIIEHVLSHRLAEGSSNWRRGMLGEQRCFWDYIMATCSQLPYNCLGVVQALDYPRTQEGKGRAWIRLALMEKRLAEYFITAMQQVRTTLTFFEEGALMLSEDINILIGYLLALNSLEFNFVVKDQYLDFDSTPAVDYSAFLQYPQSKDRDTFHHQSQDDNTSVKQLEVYKPNKSEPLYQTMDCEDNQIAIMSAQQSMCCAAPHQCHGAQAVMSHIKVDVNINKTNTETESNGKLVEIPPARARLYAFLRQETVYGMAWIESCLFSVVSRIINWKKLKVDQ